MIGSSYELFDEKRNGTSDTHLRQMPLECFLYFEVTPGSRTIINHENGTGLEKHANMTEEEFVQEEFIEEE